MKSPSLPLISSSRALLCAIKCLAYFQPLGLVVYYHHEWLLVAELGCNLDVAIPKIILVASANVSRTCAYGRILINLKRSSHLAMNPIQRGLHVEHISVFSFSYNMHKGNKGTGGTEGRQRQVSQPHFGQVWG